jgi:hypothetical protein
MTIEEAYNKLVDRLEYINEELSIYPNIKTVEGRAYHIGTIHQHVREAAQIIADYQKQLHPINQDCIGVLNPSSHTHIAGETKSTIAEADYKSVWTIEKFFEETRKSQKTDEIVLDNQNIDLLCDLIDKNYTYVPDGFSNKIDFHQLFTNAATKDGGIRITMYAQQETIKYLTKTHKHVAKESLIPPSIAGEAKEPWTLESTFEAMRYSLGSETIKINQEWQNEICLLIKQWYTIKPNKVGIDFTWWMSSLKNTSGETVLSRETQELFLIYLNHNYDNNRKAVGVPYPHSADEAKSDYEVKPLGDLTAFHIASEPATNSETVRHTYGSDPATADKTNKQ